MRLKGTRRTALAAAGAAGALGLVTATAPGSAAAGPRPAPALSLTLSGDVVVATAAHFPGRQRMTLVAAVPHGHGSVVVTADRTGYARAGFRLPSADWSGTVQVSGASGRARALATIPVTGGGGPADRDGVAASDLHLFATSVAAGAPLSASVTLRTTRKVTFKQVVISVRDSHRLDVPALDFPAAENLTVDGTHTLTGTRSEDHADTYQVSVVYTLDGVHWVRLQAPTAAFTVTGSVAPPTASPTPTSSPTSSPTATPTTTPTTTPTATATPRPSPTVTVPASPHPSPTVGTTSPASPSPSPGPTTAADIPGAWKLAFDDEFTGNALDLTRWQLCNPSFRALCLPWNDEREIFDTATSGNPNVTVSGGQLHLTTTKVDGQIWSGMVSTGPWPAAWGTKPAGYRGFSYTYGYYEGRVRMPRGDGFWPSLWELPQQQQQGALGWPDTGEYDVVEIPGNDPTEYHFTAHWGGGGGACGHPCSPQQATISDSSATWHTFGLDWEPTGLTWYVDGHKMGYTVTDPGAVKNYPFYLIANFSVGGDWGPLHGGPDASTPFPASMDIDWLRVYQHT